MKYPGNRSSIVKGGVVAAAVLLLLAFVAWGLDTSGRRAFSESANMMPIGAPSAFKDMMLYATQEASDDYVGAYDTSIATAGDTAAEVDQKIIKTGNLSITAEAIDSAVKTIIDAAVAAGGFVQSSNVEEDYVGNRYGSVTVRVPAASFEATMATIKNLAISVERESSEGQDVTERYTDLKARLSAAQAQEEQYLVILEDATTVGEVLAVQEHLADVRADIESMQGQINYLENLTSYSTITVSVTEETRITLPAEKFDVMREIRLAAKYVVILGQRTLTATIWLLIVGGAVVLPVSLVAWVIWKLVKRFQK